MVEAKQPTVFDSDQQQLGDVYARALLAFAADAGNVDQLVDELGEVVEPGGAEPGVLDPTVDLDRGLHRAGLERSGGIE